MTERTDRPDAVLFEAKFCQGLTSYTRIDSICSRADGLLKIKPGERTYVRKMLHSPYVGMFFVTRHPDCHINYPDGHEKKPECRYEWEQGTDPGIQLGWLKEDAERYG